ncbi:NAD(P)-binding domain-containing protein [Flavobacterium ajazii]|uniref:NAD(P)-binding domain-containing protein n=1 Tax=Flavobacterium ajazii TaxID=2692318 RepID=UPI0013D2DD64|nr:NAD(P)-binding domain-containing protein [Flavobacterium ajazii]
MRIGIIGICSLTIDFAYRAAKSGHQVLISHSRENSHLKDLIQKMGPKIKLVAKNEAAKAGILILFIPREDLQLFLTDLPDMTEKILIHASNPIFSLECLEPNSKVKSSSEIIASLLPEAHVIKILNIANQDMLSFLKQNENEIFFTGTNSQAKNKVKTFFKTLELTGVDFEELYLPPILTYSAN